VIGGLKPVRRVVAGCATTLGGIAVATAALLPLRDKISGDAAALVLVVPVTLGVAVGGFPVVPVGVVAGFLTFDYFFIPPYYTLAVGDHVHWASLVVYGLVGLIVGGVVAQLQRTRRQAEEQAALRRVATMVGRAASPEEVFAAVAAESGRLLETDVCVMSRYDADGGATVVGTWARTGAAEAPPAGTRFEPGEPSLHTVVLQTGRPARVDHNGAAHGGSAHLTGQWGVRSAVGVPVSLDGRLWGVIFVASHAKERLAADTEAWLAGFTDLLATALGKAQAGVELRGHAEEQAALRRVAVLIARAAPPEEVFAAVTAEVGLLLQVDTAVMGRYDPGGVVTVVATWNGTGEALPVPIGTRTSLGGRNVTTQVFETGRPARMDDHADATGRIGEIRREQGMRATVGVPISVEDRVWGVMLAVSRRDPLAAGTEVRLAGFTELVATGIGNAQARMDLRRFADEQAALRRVAVLVAEKAPPDEVFAAVATEVGGLLGVDFALLSRYETDGTVAVVGGWARADPGGPQAVGLRFPSGGPNIHAMVLETGRPARIDNYADASGLAAEMVRDWGLRSAVGAPIRVGGRLWGVMCVACTRVELLPPDTEARLSAFTQLVGTALANAEAQAALTASRARIVAAADTARRRIERDLHDGAQQRLVALAMDARTARAAVPPEAGGLAVALDGLADGLTAALDELRETAGGIHPVALAKGGLRPALNLLARRSPIPVHLDVAVDGRLPEAIELAVYYVVAEALTNAAKHAQATTITVEVAAADSALRVRVRDDGRGGADVTAGSGLLGLADRVETLSGYLSLHSPPGEGTTLDIALPLPAGD
jgi:signal transduction histidine kinase